jgi:hypothetical protein
MFSTFRRTIRPAARTLIVLSIAAAIASVAVAGKPAPPPPPPPAIVYDIAYIPGLTGQINGLNEAGDIIVWPDRVYIAALGEVSTANDWLVDPNWSINGVYAINNVGQIAVHAVYQGAAGAGFTPGVTNYYGILDLTDGSFSPLFERTAVSHTIEAMNDLGQVCGTAHPSSGKVYAFAASPYEGAPTYLFPDEIGLVTSWGHDINNAGQIVGYRAGTAFRYTPGEPTLMLSALAGESNGESINEAGEFAGYQKVTVNAKTLSYSYRPFRYTDGVGVVMLADANALVLGAVINEPGDALWSQSTRTGMDPVINLRDKNLNVDLMTSGVVQGSAADLTKWKSDEKNYLHLNSSRKIVGYGSEVFVLTPRP